MGKKNQNNATRGSFVKQHNREREGYYIYIYIYIYYKKLVIKFCMKCNIINYAKVNFQIP